MSMGKQHLDLKKKYYLRELSGSKFHSVTSSNVILHNDVKTQFHQKWIYLVLELSSSILHHTLISIVPLNFSRTLMYKPQVVCNVHYHVFICVNGSSLEVCEEQNYKIEVKIIKYKKI